MQTLIIHDGFGDNLDALTDLADEHAPDSETTIGAIREPGTQPADSDPGPNERPGLVVTDHDGTADYWREKDVDVVTPD